VHVAPLHGRIVLVDLPVLPPARPMLATSVPDVPEGPGFLYEPTWDA
jgi:hypothetical protein